MYKMMYYSAMSKMQAYVFYLNDSVIKHYVEINKADIVKQNSVYLLSYVESKKKHLLAYKIMINKKWEGQVFREVNKDELHLISAWWTHVWEYHTEHHYYNTVNTH